jgi:hypothetical protein
MITSMFATYVDVNRAIVELDAVVRANSILFLGCLFQLLASKQYRGRGAEVFVVVVQGSQVRVYLPV